MNNKKIDILRGYKMKAASDEMLQYTNSIDHDYELFEYVIKVNTVHVLSLYKKGIIERNHALKLIKSLKSIRKSSVNDYKLEDVHMNIENIIIKKTGKKIGGQLNLGKSRNDQVVTSIRLLTKNYIIDLLQSLINLEKVLLQISKKNTSVVIPSYTHLQQAQFSTVSHYYLAHHDSIFRDIQRLLECYDRVNKSTMGAGAISTVLVEIDRKYVANLLGFDGLVENSIDSVSNRDFMFECISLLSILMTNVEKIANEIILWNSSEFSYLNVSDKYASTSSIMPQKKNPAVAEIIRAKTAKILGNFVTSMTIVKNLTLGYHLDYQEITPKLSDSFVEAISTVDILSNMLKEITFNENTINNQLDNGMGAADLANYLAEKNYVSFREAHHIVGMLSNLSIQNQISLKEIVKTKLSVISKQISNKSIELSDEQIENIMSPLSNVNLKKTIGGPSISQSNTMISKREKNIKTIDHLVKKMINKLDSTEHKLESEICKLEEVKS